MNVPKNLFYSKDHEWIKIDGNKATIGITDFAQNQLGDVVFVETPAPQTALKAGDSIGSIESVKAVSDVYAPVSGMVADVNMELESAPQTVNEDPYGKGWICVLEMTDAANETKNLLDAAAYEKLLTEEAK
jgi:glycine cleavage system H protein